jgi:hypothetical protein
MTKYQQAPAGWWQDAHHVAQPPGSYRDHSRRVGEDPDGADLGPIASLVRRLTARASRPKSAAS